MGSGVKSGICRGQIYWVDIPRDETRGSEQFKRRPWLIVSGDHLQKTLPIVLAVPLSTQIQKQRQFRGARIRIPASEITPKGNWQPAECIALTEQVRVLSHERLGNVAATVSKMVLSHVEAGLVYLLDIAI